MSRRRLLFLAAALLGLVIVGAAVIWRPGASAPPAGASRGERAYLQYCTECHGRDGRGSWRSTLFLVHPGDLTDRTVMGGQSDEYLFEIIKHGGSPIGRPGMPGFGFLLSDEDIRAVIGYLRQISGTSRS